MWVAVVLRSVVAPAVAYVLGGPVLGLEGEALAGPVIVAALPTAQNIFVYAMRYGRAVPLAREVILITSLLSVPVVVALAAVLG
jgi:predicted permease